MKKQEMIEVLTERGENVRAELIQIQQTFSSKKETLIRIEGALEALSSLEDDLQDISSKSSNEQLDYDG